MDFDNTYADYLTEDEIKAITNLESESGKRILAFYTPPAAATIDEGLLSKIRELEKKLCVRLVAYENH